MTWYGCEPEISIALCECSSTMAVPCPQLLCMSNITSGVGTVAAVVALAATPFLGRKLIQ